MYYGLCALRNEKVDVSEAPAYDDAGDAGILGGQQVDLGIAHIDAFLWCRANFLHACEYRVGPRLAADAVLLALSTGKLEKSGEEVLHKRLYRIVALVRHHAAMLAGVVEGPYEFGDAAIGCCLVKMVGAIVLVERTVDFVDQLGVGVGLYREPYEVSNAVAHELSNFRHASWGESMLGQGVIGGGVQVVECVQQCSVEVENDGLV